MTALAGSSPLTRGKQNRREAQAMSRGLIPTHAGKTFAAALPRALVTAHPHSRGENAPMPTVVSAPYGSSPLTRGKQTGTRSGSRCPRLIPTHAGKTFENETARECAEAHPHSRGEN